MKKIISIALWSLSCLAMTPPDETIAERLQREYQSNPQNMTAIEKVFIKNEQKRQQQEQAQALSPELVDSLIEHSPALIKKYMEYLQYSRSKGEVKPKALLVHGPSGIGKTETAIALAIKAKMSYTIIHGAQLGDKYQNSAKNQLKALICPIIERDKPHVIIIDECMRLVENYNDEKGTHEDNNTATAFWDLLDQCTKAKNIFVIATANSIERCPEMVRTRFGSNMIVEFKMPDVATRKKILRIQLPKEYTCREEVLNQLAQATEGISPRDFKNIVELATFNVKRENKGRTHFEFEDFKNEIEQCKEANKKKGFLTKTLENAKNNIENNPWGTFASIGAGLGGIANFVSVIAQNSQRIANSSAAAISTVLDHVPQITHTINEPLASFAINNISSRAAFIFRLLPH